MAEILGREATRLGGMADKPSPEKETGYVERIGRAQLQNNERLHMAACRLEDIADQLLGKAEPRAEKENPRPGLPIAGSVGGLATVVNDNDAIIQRINATISRLERA